MGENFKYTAFISYSHSDKAAVKWLHRALERFHIPKNLVGEKTSKGNIPKKFQPFFRDRDDLSAATSLTKSIKKALESSRYMIVVCSPEASKSVWVGKEIEKFIKLRGRENIFFLIARGGGKKYRELFPDALWDGLSPEEREAYDPIAADLREGRDGKRLAKLKLVSALLGIELDALIQREARRRQIQIGAIAGVTSVTTLVLAVLLYIATEARKEAEANRLIAEERQFQAEELVGFMLGDLRENLTPIGSLEIMDSIAVQALGYYSAIDPELVTDEALRRRAEVLLMLGEIQDQRGNSDQASFAFQEAFRTTGEILSRDPENPDLIFDHSQSVFWVAYFEMRQGNLEAAEAGFRRYADYAQTLAQLEPGNEGYLFEVGYAYSNLGTLFFRQGKFLEAEKEFQAQLSLFSTLLKNDPESGELKYEVAQSHAWLADAQAGLGKFSEALDQRKRELALNSEILAENPQNASIRRALLVTYQRLGVAYAALGDADNAGNFQKEGMALGEELIAFDPENTFHAQQLAWLILDYLEDHWTRIDAATKETLLQRAGVLTQTLVDINPENEEWGGLFARGHAMRATDKLAAGDLEEGLALALTASQKMDVLWQEEGPNFGLFTTFGHTSLVLAGAYKMLGKKAEADQVLKTFVDRVDSFSSRITVKGRDYLGRAWFGLGQKEKAQQKYDFLVEIGYLAPDFQLFWEQGRIFNQS